MSLITRLQCKYVIADVLHVLPMLAVKSCTRDQPMTVIRTLLSSSFVILNENAYDLTIQREWPIVCSIHFS